MGDLIENSVVRGVDGKVYTLGGPRKMSEDEKKRSFVAAISEGNEAEVKKRLEDTEHPMDPNGSVPVSVASLHYDASGQHLTFDVRCAGGEATFWRGISMKLHQRIEAERTRTGRAYVPITCEDTWGATYQLTPLMVAYLYGNQNIIDLLKSKGANPNSTTVIYYYVREKEFVKKAWAATKMVARAAVFGVDEMMGKVYSEPWKPERFAFPSRSAKGGTRRRRKAKKVPRRNRGTRRTPQKK